MYAKILGFGRHIDLVAPSLSSDYHGTPISGESVKKVTNGISEIQQQEPYALIGGVATTDNETEAIVLRGVMPNYNWDFLKSNLKKGKLPVFLTEKKSNEILISQTLANRLKLEVGDRLYTHFLQRPPRSRAFKIAGIYDTGITDFDKLFIIGDIRQVQKLNNWQSSQYSGVSLTLSDFNQQGEVSNLLRQKVVKLFNENEQPLRIISAKKRFAHIFDWLDIMNVNVKIVLFLILLVSSFNMISALLVIILEKTRHIGVLKALGMHNTQLRTVFLYKSAYIIGKGMFWGNILGVGLAFLQQKFHLIPLAPETYYLSTVPIKIDF
ncbi:MAG: ABC transporter permease, partial [Bacteroidia bacterium]